MKTLASHIHLGGLDILDHRSVSGDPRWTKIPHRSHRERIQFYTRGSGELKLDNHRFTIEPGMALLYRRGMLQRGSRLSSAPLGFIQVYFDLHSLGNLPLLQWEPRPVGIRGDSFDKALRFITQLMDKPVPQSPAGLIRQSAAFLEILSIFLETSPGDGVFPEPVHEPSDPELNAIVRNEKILLQAVRFIESHLDSGLDRQTVARACGLTPKQLDHAFKGTLQTTPATFIKNLRMAKARELLKARNALVREVAEQVGYTDPFHFSRVFKCHHGYPPSGFHQSV